MKKKLHNINKAKIDDIYYSPYYKFSKNKNKELIKFISLNKIMIRIRHEKYYQFIEYNIFMHS